MSDVYSRAQSGVGATAPIKLNRHGPSAVAISVIVVGTATYNVESTLEDVENPPTAGITWFVHPVLGGQSASKQDNYAYLPRAIRLNQTSGTGSTTLYAVQAGIAGV